MATSITTSYVGIGALDIISKSILSANTLEKGFITVIPNIKKSYKLVIGSGDNIIQSDSCPFSAQGTITLSERSLDPAHLKVNFQDCKTVLENHWQAALMQAGALNSDYTPVFEKFVMDYVADKTAEGVEKLIWQGNKAGSTGIFTTYPFLTSIDGLVVKASAAVDTIKITKTSLTSVNILGELVKVHNAIPDEVFDKADLQIFMNRKTYRLYRQAIQSSYIGNSAVQDITKGLGEVGYQGITISVVDIADNTMLVGTKSNLFLGTDLVSDFNEVKLLDLSETTGDDFIRVKSRFSADTNFAVGSELVIYA